MNKSLDLSILRDAWMMTHSAILGYSQAAVDYLAGREISTGLFSKISLPDVPDNIALIPINGAMTKADICGGMGTRSLANMVNEAAADNSKSSIILFFESVPGGQVDGTKVLGDAVKAAALKKPVLSAVSGMCCSAGVWPMSQSTEAYATSATDMIGCIGVMAQIKKQEAGAVAEYEVVYSDLSPDKNKEFTDASVMKENLLNPVAKMFQEAVTEGRGDKLKVDATGLLSGATFLSATAKKNGLIDGAMPFEKIVQRANYLSKKQKSNNMSGSKNIATAEQFKFQHILAAAGADSAVPVEEGFALTEQQMNTLDAAIGNFHVEAAAHQVAMDAAGEALIAAQATITAQENQITSLQTIVTEYAPKKAAATADPVAAKDDYTEQENKFLTSVDKEARKMLQD